MRPLFFSLFVAIACALVAGCSHVDLTTPTQRWDEASPADSSSSSSSSSSSGAAPAKVVGTEPTKVATSGSALEREVGSMSALECEAAAREAYGVDHDAGWKMLRACIAKGGFTVLKPLVDKPWDKELGVRKSGALLLAQVIAARGGDLEGDLKICNEHKIPLFSLSAALAEPDDYKGRLLLVRGTVSARKHKGPRTSLLVGETAIGAQTFDVAVGPKYQSQSKYSGQAQGSSTSSRNGSASAQVSGSASSQYSSSTTVEKHKNLVEPTGRRLLVNVDADDPFLKVKSDYVFLVRFDGVRDLDPDTVEQMREETDGADDDVPSQEAVVTVVGYFEPSPLLTF